MARRGWKRCPGLVRALDGLPFSRGANGMQSPWPPRWRAHVAELHYTSPGLRAGAVISLCAILAACAFAAYQARGGSRRGSHGGPGTSRSERPLGNVA